MQHPYAYPPGYRVVAMPAGQPVGALPLPPMPMPQMQGQTYLVPIANAHDASVPPPPYPGYFVQQSVAVTPPPYAYSVSPHVPPMPPYGFPMYAAPQPAAPAIAAHIRPLPVPVYSTPPPPIVQPLPPPPDPQLQRPVFNFAHAPGSLYHQRFQTIAAQREDEVLREGALGFSMTGDSFAPYWIHLQNDLLLCSEQRHLPPLWKIKLWGTSIEPFDERTHPSRFMVITGLGQVFSFQASSFEEAIEWRAALNAAAGHKSAPSPSPSASPSPSPSSSLTSSATVIPHTMPPSVVTEHKTPLPKVVVVATEAPPVTTQSRRSQGIGGFFSSLFESAPVDGKWVKEMAAQGEPKKFAFEQLRQEMSNANHTLGKPVEAFSAKISASAALTDDEFARVVREILDFIRDSIVFIGKTYPDFGATNSWEETAHRATEAALLPKIYPLISKLYEWKYRAENERHAAKNKEFLTVTPAHLNIPKLFWLSHADDTAPSEAELARWVPPYFDAIEHMKQLPTLKSASLKLDCLVEVGKIACACITKFWEGRIDPAKLIVGADDLLPIMTYVVIKARIPTLYSEAMLMQDLMTEKAAMEIGGYSLATLQTCLSHLMVLERREALQAGEDQLRAKRHEPASSAAAQPQSQSPASPPPVSAPSSSLSVPAAAATTTVAEPSPSSLSNSAPLSCAPSPDAPAASQPPAEQPAQSSAVVKPTPVSSGASATIDQSPSSDFHPPVANSTAAAPAKSFPQLPVVFATPPASPQPSHSPAPASEPVPLLPPPPGDKSPARIATQQPEGEEQDLMKFQ